MKIVLVLLFVGSFSFSTAGKLDEESLLEALRSALSDDVDDTTRGDTGPYVSDIDDNGDLYGLHGTDEAALQTIRELLAGNSDADLDDDIDYKSRRGLVARGIRGEGIRNGIAELEGKRNEAKEQLNNASDKAKTETQNIVNDITKKIKEKRGMCFTHRNKRRCWW